MCPSSPVPVGCPVLTGDTPTPFVGVVYLWRVTAVVVPRVRVGAGSWWTHRHTTRPYLALGSGSDLRRHTVTPPVLPGKCTSVTEYGCSAVGALRCGASLGTTVLSTRPLRRPLAFPSTSPPCQSFTFLEGSSTHPFPRPGAGVADSVPVRLLAVRRRVEVLRLGPSVTPQVLTGPRFLPRDPLVLNPRTRLW